MKTFYAIILCLAMVLNASFAFGDNLSKKNAKARPAEYEALPNVSASQADSAYLFAFAPDKGKDRNGLDFAWSLDKVNWHEIGPQYDFVQCDYGEWGRFKQMFDPSIRRKRDGLFEVVWNVTREGGVVAHTYTADFINWKPQDYYNKQISDYMHNAKTTLTLPFSGKVEGEVFCVEFEIVQNMINAYRLAQYESQINSERAIDDAIRFKGLSAQQTTVTVGNNSKSISQNLIGIFFEDISYAADGGLYAELIQNRDFEYKPSDRYDKQPEWTADYAWTAEGLDFKIDSVFPLTTQNPHYGALKTNDGQGRLSNSGYDGIVIRKNEKYDFSLFGRIAEGEEGNLVILLLSDDNRVLGAGSVALTKGSGWTKHTATIQALGESDNAHLSIIPQSQGSYHLDMVSLFPQDTYKGRKNGLRKDLAQVLEDLHPKFVRFPGGCVAHGDGLDNLYRWKNTIGPLESRVPNWNIWGYHQSVGMGYYEFFQMCEDLGAEPLPVLAAGVPCQNSHTGGNGQNGGIPMDQMDQYVQDVLDLVQWANGDPETSEWAKKRAEAGHPEPFNLKYIGIGNEDLISDVFVERFKMIYNAVHSIYPDIQVVGTVGPFYKGSDYDEGWRLARQLNIPIVDEHYYESPGWFMNHQDFYDRYQRGGTKVYLGEYAAHIDGRANCLETALAEAQYLCNVERNGDVVEMTSYAPLFAKEGHTNWNPDMIYFNNTKINLTTGYQVQKLFGNNSGDEYLSAETKLSTPNADVAHRVVSSVVKDSKTGDIIIKLVNILPVANNFTVQLPISISSAKGEMLTGNLADTNLTPTAVTNISTSGTSLSVNLPAYSFVVIRAK